MCFSESKSEYSSALGWGKCSEACGGPAHLNGSHTGGQDGLQAPGGRGGRAMARPSTRHETVIGVKHEGRHM
jgi:hypothetical protein